MATSGMEYGPDYHRLTRIILFGDLAPGDRAGGFIYAL